MRILRPFLVFWMGGCVLLSRAQDSPPGRTNAPERPPLVLTNSSQLRGLSSLDLNRGCPFHFHGIVTLVDTNRNLLVLQDAGGAIALHADSMPATLQAGQQVSVEGASAAPYIISFPDYPYRPSGRDIRPSFEAPSNWGDYNLTRMRGYLHPPMTGDYTFWIASDNMGELWLSPDDDPARVRRIAFVREWVDPHQWTRDPAQRSETIFLRADQSYYIEAFQVQLTLDEHLSVAWQGPGLKQAVINGRYLTPWSDTSDRSPVPPTNGILREYWTNFFNGSLVGISGPRPFDSALSADQMQVTILGQGNMPEPRRINLNQPLRPEDRYRLVEVEGTISFAGNNGASTILELTDGQGQAQVRLSNSRADWPADVQNWLVRVHGVCEGTRSQSGLLTPGLIWASTEDGLSFIEPITTNRDSATRTELSSLAPTNANPALGGFYLAHGVVTFNDRVFGRDCMFVQEGASSIFISQEGRGWAAQARVGQRVEVGGDLLAGKFIPGLRPLTFTALDWRPMPEPVEASIAGNRDGRWTELEGVVRSVNPDGTLTLMGKRGPTSIWMGQAATNDLGRYVDSTLRVRGVMSLTLLDGPLLLIPSPNFVQVEEEPPAKPFEIPSSPIANLSAPDSDIPWVHRVKITGAVTYQNDGSLFVLEASGGARVQVARDVFSMQIGQSVEVLGFPETGAPMPTLTQALLRPRNDIRPLAPQQLDLNEIATGRHGGSLVTIKANLLSQKTGGLYQVLELQEGQRVFQALLATNQDSLPLIAPGSRLEITGVCDIGPVAPPVDGKAGAETSSVRSLDIWLRSPLDVVRLRGPPWWTLKRVAFLIGALLAILMITLLWIQLLRQRFKRQQAVQLVVSRKILQSQEGERRRIAANLHDSLGQNLLVIKNQARLAMQPVLDKPAMLERLNEISGMASQAIEEVRQIALDLRPYQLDRLGLTQAIRTIIRRVSENCPIQFASHVDEIDGLFVKESEINIYRIVQEGLNNVIKHSNATEATIVIKKQSSGLSISMRDNGRGFDAGLMEVGGLPNAGFGLSGVSERARVMGGKAVLDSRPGQGVNLTVEIPLPKT